jgi:hypothetical protein
MGTLEKLLKKSNFSTVHFLQVISYGYTVDFLKISLQTNFYIRTLRIINI